MNASHILCENLEKAFKGQIRNGSTEGLLLETGPILSKHK